ncbi:unnamed protein product [Effrenium voratum]|nr:unnamed protein product [Effrenium voratum]
MRYLLAFWGALAPTSADISLSTSLGPAWVQVYSRNFSVPYEPLLPRDIRRLQASEVEGADLWVMSPPCQPYTRMGLQRDLADRRAAPLKRLLELLPKLRRPPEGLLLENVVGFETSASFELLSEALCRAGLEVRQFMLSPLQLGIPNRRPRIYLLARRSDTPCVHPLESAPCRLVLWDLAPCAEMASKEFPGQQRSPEPQRLETFLQPRQAGTKDFGGSEIDTETSVPAKLLELLWNRGQRWEAGEPGGDGGQYQLFNFHLRPSEVCEPFNWSTGAEQSDDRRSDWCPPRPLPGGRMQRLVEPGEAVRYFTPQELLRIHGFPETFSFGKATQHQRYKLIGDSINVNVVAELMRYLLFEWMELACIDGQKGWSTFGAHWPLKNVTHRYVLSRKDELDRLAAAEDSAAGPFSVSPFVPCAAGRIPYVLQAARLSSEDVLWDLGCGDGVVLIEAARRCGCRCVGLDIDGPCIEAARRRACEAGVAELCTWLRCDMLTLPQGTLSGAAEAPKELQGLAATVALVFLTAHGLVRFAPWLHQEWASARLRLITCVESLDSAVDFNEPDALFANPNPLNWPVCRDLERWGVFVVPPCGEDVGAWSAGARPLQLTRAEAEATQAVVLRVLDEAEVDKLNEIGGALLAGDDTDEGIDLFATSEAGFHKAAEAALHRSQQHRVLYLHSSKAMGLKSAEVGRSGRGPRPSPVLGGFGGEACGIHEVRGCRPLGPTVKATCSCSQHGVPRLQRRWLCDGS